MCNLGCKHINEKNGLNIAEKPLGNIALHQVHCMLIGRNIGSINADSVLEEVRDPVIIVNSNYVQSVFYRLQKCPLVEGKPWWVRPGRPVIFMDEDKNPICAFRYWQSSKPRDMFERCATVRKASRYYVGETIYEEGSVAYDLEKGSVVLKTARCIEGISVLFSEYIDLYK